MNPELTEIDALQAERAEQDILIGNGVYFPTEKRSILRFFGKSTRKWVLKQHYLGTMDHLAVEMIEMRFSEEDLKDHPISESRRISGAHARRCARVVALSVLNDYWLIKLFTPLLTWYFLWHLTADKLFKLTMIIHRLSNMVDFSI